MPKDAMTGLDRPKTPFQLFSPDSGLVRAAQGGDRGAFDILVRRHDPFLTRFIQRMLPAQSVADVQQDIWLAAWVSIAKFDGRARFTTWLLQIGMNKVRDWYRSNRHEMNRVDSAEVEETSHDPFPRCDVRLAVIDAVATLTEERQEVIDLYYGAGLTMKEISKILQRNPSTVKYQFYEAHKQLEQKLGLARSEN